MTNSELIAKLTTLFPSFAPKDVQLAVDLILGAVSESLGTSARVHLRGFGSCTVVVRRPRTARHPGTGESVQVPATFFPHFKAGKELRGRVISSIRPLVLAAE